jgi:hypothetical protein
MLMVKESDFDAWRGKRFFFAPWARTASEAQAAAYTIATWGWGLFPRRWRAWDAKLISILCLVLKFRLQGAILPLPHMSQWRDA